MRSYPRRTAPKVRQGKVQRKNRCALTVNCYNAVRPQPVIERHKPGFGYRHVLRKVDIERFLGLLPDWPELSQGLNAILLAAGNDRCYGWYRPGIVAVCAWEREFWSDVSRLSYEADQRTFERIGVVCEPIEDRRMLLKWTESTIRAFQLTDVLLHELGHHHDRMTTRSQRQCARGEAYAERYAIRYSRLIWDRYLNEFGLP